MQTTRMIRGTQSNTAAHSPTPCVLVLSDNPDFVVDVPDYEATSNVRYIVAATPIDCISILTTGRVDAVVCDVSTSLDGGPEFLEVVRSCWPGIVRLLIVSDECPLSTGSFTAAQAALSKSCTTGAGWSRLVSAVASRIAAHATEDVTLAA